MSSDAFDDILEKLLKNEPAETGTIPFDKVKKLVENLRLHQTELEMQNDELRRAQQEIERGRQRFADLFDSAPIGYVTIKDRTITEANLTAAALLGTEEAKLVNAPFAFYVPPEWKEEFFHHLSTVLKHGRKESVEIMLRKQAMEYFWAQLESITVQDPSDAGDKQIIRTAIIDITERRNAREALEMSEEKYRALIESVNSAIISLDNEGRVIFLNNYGHDLFGYTEEELWGKGVFGTIVPEETKRPIDVRSLMAYIKAHPDQYREREMENLRRTGEKVWMSWTVRALHDAEGRFSGLLCVGNDITQRKKLEDEIRQAQKMEAIGTLAGGIAHDFNNVLAAIIGFAEMVEEDLPPDSNSRGQVQKILKAASRGAELVRQILAFSRKTDAMKEPLRVSPIIRETVHLLRASLPATIEIELDVNAARDTVLASPTRIQQILMNLATNASAAMREAGGTIKIGVNNIALEPGSPVSADVEPGDYVRITVADTGCGIPSDIMERMFEPFFTTKKVGEGTGMGLAVVFGIVKALSGTITVESKPGTGSIFRVFLPVADIGEKTDGSETATMRGGSEKILFVDDEELIVEWGKAALERLGYQVIAVMDSVQALQSFSEDPHAFDLIIADQTMPGLTGLEFAKKALAIRPGMPIILCTGHSETVSADHAKEAGVRAFLIKPLARAELAAAIRKALNKKVKRASRKR